MKSLKTAAKVTAPFVAGFVLSLSLRDVLEQSDFGKTLERYIPAIPVWWDKGDMYPVYDIINDTVDLHIPEIVPKIGAVVIIAIVAILIFKLKIKKPKK